MSKHFEMVLNPFPVSSFLRGMVHFGWFFLRTEILKYLSVFLVIKVALNHNFKLILLI